jgi:hypothetical protein
MGFARISGPRPGFPRRVRPVAVVASGPAFLLRSQVSGLRGPRHPLRTVMRVLRLVGADLERDAVVPRVGVGLGEA